MNKKGFEWSSLIPYLVIGGIFLIVLVATGFASQFEFTYNFDSISAEIGAGTSFGDAWNANSASFLDYIFGTIPSVLIEGTNEISASIIIIGVWFLFFLIFGDIISLFGMFSKQVSWIVAAVLSLILANLKLIMIATVVALGITAVFGAFSVIASLMLIFGLFLAFHFAFGAWGRKVRESIIIRRAEDSALRATAGGKVAASGIDVLNEIAKKAKKGAEGS